MTEPEAHPIEILLVEDSAADVRLTREALREAKIRNRLHVVTDGLEAVSRVTEGELLVELEPETSE